MQGKPSASPATPIVLVSLETVAEPGMAACTVLRGSLSSFLCRKAGCLCLLWTPHGRGLSFPMGGPSYLPLGCDPDGYAAVVPPARDTQRGVVGPPHLGGGVVEHVVNHPMVLNVFA